MKSDDIAHLQSQLRAMRRRIEIEEALERIRAEALSMNRSGDIAAVTAHLFEILQSLGFPTLRCAIGIVEDGSQRGEIWTSTRTVDGKIHHTSSKVDLTERPELVALYGAWQRQEPFFSYELAGEELMEYLNFVYPELKLEGFSDKFPEYQHINVFMFRHGGLFVISGRPLNEEEKWMAGRFSNVFELAYTRFLDLQHAEERVRDALMHASLHYIRAEIASMRKSEDLQIVTPLVWSELRKLGVPFFRCGVFILENDDQTVRAYLTRPDGSPLDAIDFPFESNPIFASIFDSWKSNAIYITTWEEEDFVRWRSYVKRTVTLPEVEEYLNDAESPDHLVLHFIPFTQGMLYVGGVSELSTVHLETVSALGRAFSIAYARYLDFVELEKKNVELAEAKQHVEQALEHLKQTQEQLVHAEKMAAIGKLTSGIAHEIQNPLNFVNNFALLNLDMMGELIDRLKNDPSILTPEFKELLRDLRENSERIRSYGERADSIVKSMFDTTRVHSGKRESTDVNHLVDEYTNLALLRLSNREDVFDVSMSRGYARSLPPVELIPSEIGQVILTLCNNAIYAMEARASQAGEAYEPLIRITTGRSAEFVYIQVSDNGVGLSEEEKKHIFEPFFSCLRTGNQPGVGLSMSYEIVVGGHAGSLTVASHPETITAFTIYLPLSGRPE